MYNENRGGGFFFGANVTQHFLNKNHLDLLIRSHECKRQGFEIVHDGSVVTIFSAPNYCGKVGNVGAVLHYGYPRTPPNKTQIVPIQTQQRQDHSEIAEPQITIRTFGPKHYPYAPVDDYPPK